MSTPAPQPVVACSGCGAGLRFDPGQETLTCPYCNARTAVSGARETAAQAVEELDFDAWASRLAGTAEGDEVLAARCSGCGAETTLPPNVVAEACPFCGSSLLPAAQSERAVRPRALLPFRVTRADAEKALERWVGTLWFAPNDFVKGARREGGITGVYVPYWTYDARAVTRYAGMRGEWYWVSETYTTTENGRQVTRTRQVRKTRWYPASGTVHDAFDDVLVVASGSLPEKEATALQPWDLDSLVPYSDEYLAGFRAECYQCGLEEGFAKARPVMEAAIHQTIRADIGGDEQMVTSADVRYSDVTFKHVLLPVWVGAWRHGDRVYRRIVNARTGEVQGERPWSWIKITLAVLFALAVLAVVALLFGGEGSAAASAGGLPELLAGPPIQALLSAAG